MGLLGAIVLILVICALFMFVVPLESYSGEACLFSNPESTSNPTRCLCAGLDFRLTPSHVKPNYHLLLGELKAYQDAKPLLDSCYGETLKLYL